MTSTGAELDEPAIDRGTLYTLALGTFAIGTEGFMIAAILPSIAESLHTSIEAAGQLVTIFALTYAASSPLMTAFTAAWPRRQMLVLSLAGFTAANLIAAVAPGYWGLAAARVLLAMAAGLYVPNANAFASALVPAAYRGRALAIVNGGISSAVAIGVPAGAFVGAYFGWRATFIGIAGLSAVALIVLVVRLPRDIAISAPAGLRARLTVIAMPGVFSALLTTTLWATGNYAVYTYVSPFLQAAAGLRPEHTGYVLALYGVCAIAGGALGGYASDRFGPRRVQAVILPVLAATFASLTAAALASRSHELATILLIVTLWGLSAWSFYPPQQARLVTVAGLAHTPVALSLNASFMYLGFSCGAALGYGVIAQISIAWIGVAGAACILAAMAVSALAWRSPESPA